MMTVSLAPRSWGKATPMRVAFVADEVVRFERAAKEPYRLLKFHEATLLKPALVERVASDKVIAKRSGGPDAKLRATFGVDAVGDRDDGVEVIVPDFAPDLSAPLGLNYREILGSCGFREFAVHEVQADIVCRGFKKRCELALREPSQHSVLHVQKG